MAFSRARFLLSCPIPRLERRRAPGRTFLAWALLPLLVAGLAGAAPNPWTDIPEASIPAAGPRVIAPDMYRTMAIDVASFRALLGSAPLEFTPGASAPLVLELPLPDGGSRSFAVLESPIMEAPLAARFPEIRTYLARGIDDPTASGRLDFTSFGFHGMIIGSDGTFYIDPYQRGDIEHYQSYWKRDFSPRDKVLEGCVVIDEDGMAEEVERLLRENPLTAHGTELRTYRAAVATTGEFTAYYGGTVGGGLAGITTTMNRVTGIYEREVSVRMVLIANNDLIIYTNAATDPYTHGNAGSMINQNQANLDAVIGSANYDIGHVCDTAGGGLAGLSVVCRAGNKARGVTGVYPPAGDPFDVDYVAHEMGHQYGGNHSFNGNAAACNGNRVASKAYEPGSGSTVMSYAGICGNQNLQAHSDDYFVWSSIDEIVTYTTLGSGNSCPVVTATGAVPPIVDAGIGGFTIPINTPFTLTGSAVTTGDPTYCWEESDLGPAGHPNTPSGNAPIFRSFDPVTGPSRTFPKLSDLLNNVHTIGELLPSYARDLTFKLTVRDFQAGGVGVDKAGIAFQSTDLAGPFLVTEPNTAVSWLGGTFEDVIWDVAGTDQAPVNCASVNILLSTDGGNTWGVVILEQTPNDGTESIYVPNIATNTARIKVEAADNIFFDISNVNFTIEESAAVGEETAALGGLVLHANQPNPFNPRTAIRLEMPSAGTATLRVYDVAGRFVATLAEGRLDAGAHGFVWDGRAASGIEAASGVYVVELRALGEVRRHQMVLLR